MPKGEKALLNKQAYKIFSLQLFSVGRSEIDQYVNVIR